MKMIIIVDEKLSKLMKIFRGKKGLKLFSWIYSKLFSWNFELDLKWLNLIWGGGELIKLVDCKS